MFFYKRKFSSLLCGFFLSIALCVFSLVSPTKAFAAILFEDNFDDNDASDWLIFGSPTNWTVVSGEYGISIPGNFQVTNTVPSDDKWNNAWVNYTYEVDMRTVSGTDKNILFRYQNSDNWYGIHHGLGRIYLEKVIGGVEYTSQFPSIPRTLYNGMTYHFRFSISGKNFKIYLNNELIFDVVDPDPAITFGKVGLRAGTGSVPNTEVWFDNVIVCDDPGQPCGGPIPTPTATPTPTLTPTPTPGFEPLILLPGLGASWNTEAMIRGAKDIPPEEWKMTPFVRAYDGLIASLENAGYEQGENFFVYHYDWRQPLDEAADDLNGFIQGNIGPPGTKIDFVGHSLGGLVARSFAQKYGTEKIDQLITAGSPHHGAVQSYLAWEGGQVSDRLNWGWLALQLLLQINKSGFQTNVETIQQMTPVAKDLLPIFNFLKKDSTEIDWQTLNQKNDYLNNLKTNANQIFDQLLAIFGHGQQTPRWYQVQKPSIIDRLLGRWEDGKPVDSENEDGDQTVLEMSAQISPDPAESLGLNHRNLVQDQAGIEKIFEALGLPKEAIATRPGFNRNHALIFLLASPAQLKVVDPDNNEFWSDELGFVIINEPKPGEYRAEISANPPAGGGGDYHLYLGQLMENEDLWSEIKENVAPGETDIFDFDIQPGSPQENPLIDPDGLGYLQLAKGRLTPFDISPRVITLLNLAGWLTEKGRYAEAKEAIQGAIVLLFRDRDRLKESIKAKEEIYLAILDLAQAYQKLCGTGQIPFNQAEEEKDLGLTEQLLQAIRFRIALLEGRGQATSAQAASFEKAQENLGRAQDGYPANLPAAHIHGLITRLLLYETR